VRVGVDWRNRAELQGRPRLEAGIYAICEVELGALRPSSGLSILEIIPVATRV